MEKYQSDTSTNNCRVNRTEHFTIQFLKSFGDDSTVNRSWSEICAQEKNVVSFNVNGLKLTQNEQCEAPVVIQ